MNYWLIKSEPSKYSWAQFVADQETFWDGIRNYAARNNLREMRVGDRALYYHSNEGLEIVGVAEVTREAFQDPTTEDANWVAVNFKPVFELPSPVSLATLKANPDFEKMELIRLSRLSVSKVTPAEYDQILKMGGRV
jgi:predicted RNA-binding protein with PUA-like domain